MLEVFLYIFLGFLWYQFIAIFGISIGLHRGLCHKQVELSKAYEVFALFLVTLTGARSPLGWIGAHKIHHATADTADDPHSPDIKGFWKVNAAGHKDFRPRTNKWINILSAGEGYHDAHHNNPKQVRLNKYDLAGFILETINKRKCFYGSVLLQKK